MKIDLGNLLDKSTRTGDNISLDNNQESYIIYLPNLLDNKEREYFMNTIVTLKINHQLLGANSIIITHKDWLRLIEYLKSNNHE